MEHLGSSSALSPSTAPSTHSLSSSSASIDASGSSIAVSTTGLGTLTSTTTATVGSSTSSLSSSSVVVLTTESDTSTTTETVAGISPRYLDHILSERSPRDGGLCHNVFDFWHHDSSLRSPFSSLSSSSNSSSGLTSYEQAALPGTQVENGEGDVSEVEEDEGSGDERNEDFFRFEPEPPAPVQPPEPFYLPNQALPSHVTGSTTVPLASLNIQNGVVASLFAPPST